MKQILTRFIYESKKLSSFAPNVIKLTGKSKEKIHPKHLIKNRQPWFIKEIKDNFSVLDIGCGNGQYAIKTAGRCWKITAMENNPAQLNIAIREKKRHKIKNIRFVNADAEKKLNFDDKVFDAVILLDVLEHLRKRDQSLKEVFRVLKKNGKFILSVPNMGTSWKKELRKYGLPYYSDPDHKIEYSEREIRKILQKSGLKNIKIIPTVFDTGWIGFIDIIGGLSLCLYQKIIRWRVNKVNKFPEESTGFRIVCKK